MRRKSAIFLISLSFVSLSACRPSPGPDKTIAGAILGAGWGAGAGAVIGNQTANAGSGAAIGAGFGAVSGALTGSGLDMAEGTEIVRQREIDALKVQVAANQRALMSVQDSLADRDRKLARTADSSTWVFFDSDRASLRAGSVAELERLADRLKRNPYVQTIHVHGHTDETGNSERNMRLSEARAKSVATFLSSHGISLDRIEIQSHGARMPVASNEIDAGRQLNRRVEISPY